MVCNITEDHRAVYQIGSLAVFLRYLCYVIVFIKIDTHILCVEYQVSVI